MSYNARHWETHEPSMSNVWRAKEEAERGSAALLQAMLDQFTEFACRHSVTIDDARLFCMNGVAP